MKKIIALVLVAVMCLTLCACGKSDACTCDCPQCAQCEKKTQSAGIADSAAVDNVPEHTEQNNNVIEFETPVVVAEDEYLRVELVKFYEEYRLWKQGYPYNADATTEGSTLEKIVVFKFSNKTDHTLSIRMDDVYLGSDGASSFTINDSATDTAAGKNVLGEFLVQTGEKAALDDMEELYSLDGDFLVWHKGNDGVLRNNYELKFSIPNGMNSNNAASASETATFKNSLYLGTWKVTDIKFAYDAPLEKDFTDAEWDIFFEAMLKPFDNIYLTFSESGEWYYRSDDGTKTGKWTENKAGVKIGDMLLAPDGNKLFWEVDGYLLYWEKVSDSQTLPEI